MFSVYPNPVDNELNIQLGTRHNTALTLRLTLLESKNTYMVLSRKIAVGIFDIKVDLSEFPKSIYLLNLETEKENRTFKIVKQ